VISPVAGDDEWLPRPIAAAVIAAALGTFGWHALVGFQGGYLDHVSGVWLSLARDLSEGVLVRDLTSDLGYGGTRYFPLFFSAIAGLLTLGTPITVAGWLVAAASLVLLTIGTFRAARALGVPPWTSGVFGAAAGASYFVQQTIFEIRADVMAAAFNMWGLAFVLPAWRQPAADREYRTGAAALFFTLAFATKVTALAIPGAVTLAAVMTRRGRLGAELAGKVGAGSVVFLIVVELASEGRALAVWGACMLGGSDASMTAAGFFSAGFLAGLRQSYQLAVLALVAVGALASAIVLPADSKARGSRAWIVPLAIWTGASATLAVTLSSPGTVPSNQVVEWIAVCLLVPVLVAAPRRRIRGLTAAIVAAVTIWMAVQDLSRAAEVPRSTSEREGVQARILRRLEALPAPVLTESALWPILAGREVIMPDPFAARVVFGSRPDLESVLLNEVRTHRYSAVILEFDPSSREGRGVYDNLHFGPTVMRAILEGYRLEEPPSGGPWVYLPRERARFDTPGRR